MVILQAVISNHTTFSRQAVPLGRSLLLVQSLCSCYMAPRKYLDCALQPELKNSALLKFSTHEKGFRENIIH